MTAGDHAFDRAAAKLREASARAAERGGIAAKLAGPLAEDASFVTKLKPTLVRERLRGRTPAADRAAAPSGPQLQPRPSVNGGRAGGGPSPLVVVAAAFAAGILLAKVIDWRGHAHPRH